MTAILFQELQFFDLNGDPLANGNVYFYQSDGSTPQNAFTDSTGGVALANPSLLNSAGRPNSGNGIWLGLNLTYTIVVKDSAGSTIYTISNLTATPAGLAPNNASYVTISAETGLSAERVLTGTANQVTITDGGSTVTLSVPYQFNVGSSATGPSEIRLFEDTDNGTNKVTITTASSIASDATVTIAATTGTLLNSANNLSDVGSAATCRTNLGLVIGTNVAAAGANTDITSVQLNNTGLRVRDTNASHNLSIVPGSDLAANRTLTLTTGDADRTLTLTADSSIGGTAYVAGGTDVPVTDGGTGLSTFTTAYGVVCAGTTATGALQNAGAGTARQILISGGASALPSFVRGGWQFISASSSIVSNEIELTSVFSGSYSHYMVILDQLVMSGGSGSNFILQFGAGGTPYTGTNYYYSINGLKHATGIGTLAADIVGSESVANIPISSPTSGALVANAGIFALTGVIFIQGPTNADFHVRSNSQYTSAGSTSGTALVNNSISGVLDAATAAITVTDLTIGKSGADTFASGTVTVFGLPA